jgi:hypothetical protein
VRIPAGLKAGRYAHPMFRATTRASLSLLMLHHRLPWQTHPWVVLSDALQLSPSCRDARSA